GMMPSPLDSGVIGGEPGDGGTAPIGDAGSGANPVDAAPEAAQGCLLDGRFALKVMLDVTWVGTEFLNVIPVINEGQGELSFVVLVEMHETPAGVDSHFRACSVSVPEFTSSLGERYQARFKDSIWDSPFMPVFSGVMQLSCHDPGCRIGGDPLVALIGAALPSPNTAWPSNPAGGTWPDHDGDGEPGIAGYMLGPEDGNYAYPPVDLIFGRRVRDLMLGLRAVVGVQGSLDSCNELHGETPGSTIQTRAMGCLTATRPPRCSASELTFLNDNLPVWTVRQGRFQAVRLEPGAECKDARQQFAGKQP
ncbi:MAG TPA: hypothetical protein VFZ61_12335, partial [Polyangiales bacterium]